MSFIVGPEAYGRFMGRYADPLAPAFADLAGVSPGQRALDVGCGPGALTAVLVDRLGAERVAAIDPSPPFVAATRERFPAADVREGSAESLPFDDHAVDVALAQLVVHFMRDPVTGLREMGRVTRPGGVVAACVWDHAGGRGPLSSFWSAAGRVVPTRGEADMPGATEGDLERLLGEAGLRDVAGTELAVSVAYASFDEWWEPYTLGVGPAGAFVQELDDDVRAAVRAACAEQLGTGPFEVEAVAWAATASTPS